MKTTTGPARSTTTETQASLPSKPDHFHSAQNRERRDQIDWWFRRIAQWFAVGGTALAGLFFLMFLVWHTIYPVPADGWLINVLDAHYAATIGVPLSAIAAFCVVTLLHVISKGDIEFSVLGFTFKGASGPVILWVMCFLAMVLGFEMLWNNST